MATSGKKTHSSVQKSSANSGILHLLPSFSVLVVSCQLLSKVLRHEPVSPAAGEYIYNIIHNLKENIKIHREKKKEIQELSRPKIIKIHNCHNPTWAGHPNNTTRSSAKRLSKGLPEPVGCGMCSWPKPCLVAKIPKKS